MDAYKTIITLRAVRRFQATPIPPDALHRILQAGRMSGSSKNTQPWTFVVIHTAETLRALSRCGNFASHLVNAPLGIAIVFDPQFYRGEFDSGRAAQNMMLAAWGDGIGACIASMHREDEAKAVLGAPQELRLEHVLSFGYPLAQPATTIEGQPREKVLKSVGRKSMADIVRYEKWS
ncbi:MAG TPA: nitroreductase family protein [Anaerolineae bacterium]|nr:nitroreductase family protein [Anaerolineae bacterium]